MWQLWYRLRVSIQRLDVEILSVFAIFPEKDIGESIEQGGLTRAIPAEYTCDSVIELCLKLSDTLEIRQRKWLYDDLFLNREEAEAKLAEMEGRKDE